MERHNQELLCLLIFIFRVARFRITPRISDIAAAAPDEVDQPLEYEGDPVDVENLQGDQPYAEEVEGGKVAGYFERVVVNTVQHPKWKIYYSS